MSTAILELGIHFVGLFRSRASSSERFVTEFNVTRYNVTKYNNVERLEVLVQRAYLDRLPLPGGLPNRARRIAAV
ncbi:MAG: hypothetical protein WBF93_16305 [Pirellulales bacterium]